MITYQNDHVSMRVEGGIHLLQQVWMGLPSTDNFTDGALTTLVLAKRHHIKRWLIDLRLLRLFNPTDVHWFVQRWLPRVPNDLPKDSRVAIVLTSTSLVN